MSVLPGKLPPISTGRLAGGLLAAARTLPADYGDWRQGITFNSHLPYTTGYHACVDPEDATDKETAAVADPLVFEPFMIYQGKTCSTWMDTEELLALTRQGLDGGISTAIARELQEPSLSTNPSLNSSAEYLGTAGVPDVFAQLAESMICDCGVTDIVFHVNLRVIPYLLDKNQIEWDGTVWRHGPYPVVADCYDESVVPDDEAPANGVNTSYMYATGPIEVAVGPEEQQYGIDAPTNDALALVERLGILRFDPTCVKAIRILLYGNPPA